MRRITAANWLWMVLAFELIKSNQTIVVTSDAALKNATSWRIGGGEAALSATERQRRLIPYMAFYLPPAQFPISPHFGPPQNGPKRPQPYQIPPTAAESAGPLPPPGYIQVPAALIQVRGPTTGSGEQRYNPLSQQGQRPHYYQSHALETYPSSHSSTHGAENGPIALKPNSNRADPILHLLPPGPQHPPPPQQHSKTLLHEAIKEPLVNYKGNNLKQKHKTVQYFPPIASHQQIQDLQQQQQITTTTAYRQRPKQSKVNLTPFSPTNSLPGHFIPIIYTPMSNSNNMNSNSKNNHNTNTNTNNKNNNANNDNTINYNYDNTQPALAPSPPAATGEDEHYAQQQQQQQQQQHLYQQQQQQYDYSHHHHYHQQQQQQHQPQEYQQIAAERPSQSSAHSQQPEEPQIEFVAVTSAPSTSSQVAAPSPSSAAPIETVSTHPTTSPIYHVINEQILSVVPQYRHQHRIQNQHQSLISPSAKYQQHQPSHGHNKHSYFHAPLKSENFFEQQQPQEQQQQLYSEHMTPQEKYVLYLQQRIRYNKQQKQRERERAKEYEHLNAKQQELREQLQHSEHIQEGEQQKQLVYTGHHPSNLPVDINLTEQQQLSEEAKVQQQQQLHQHQHPSTDYTQHSPIRHSAYARPELVLPTNHKLQSKPASSIPKTALQIPARAITNDLSVLYKQQQQQKQQQKQQYHTTEQQQKLLQHYSKGVSPATAHYIDYVIDEPKQSLDEESQQQIRPAQHEQQQNHQYSHVQTTSAPPSPPPPQAAYIFVTTSSPYLSSQVPSSNQNHYASTVRPIYKNQQPTLRLQPVSHLPSHHANYPTQRPKIATTYAPVAESPTKFVFVSPRPQHYNSVVTPAIKLKAIAQMEQEQQQHQQQQIAHRPNTATSIASNYATPTTPTTTINKETLHSTSSIDPNQLPDINTASLADILHKLQETNHLPKTLTPDNIDNSIKTLITILQNLKQTQTIVQNPSQHHEPPPAAVAADYDYTTDAGREEEVPQKQQQPEHGVKNIRPLNAASSPNKHPSPSNGRPGIDFPNYDAIPQTSFSCAQQRYKGFFGDPETNCQVWHYCDLNGGKASFLCPNGTIFSQIALTCDWWFNVKCSTTEQLYVLNERLYKYILPFTPKFPEDYSGPIVDKYLAMKFQEMEEMMRLEKEKAVTVTTEQPLPEMENSQNHIDETTVVQNTASHAQHHKVSVNSQVGEQTSERNLLIDDEVDDISQRGGIDTYESTTTAVDADLPLSLKPIVVSSTTEAGYEQDGSSSAEEQMLLEHSKNAKMTSSSSSEEETAKINRATQNFDDAKIDVEKVEVIEIKSDGNTGHLTPDLSYESIGDQRS